MPLLELLTSSGLGSLLGMRHAFEPDHLAAVSTLVTRERNGYKAALIGAWWGLGHTLSLVAVGAVLIVLRAEMSARGRGSVRVLRGPDAHRTRLADDLPGGAAGSGGSAARASSWARRAQSRRRARARPRRSLDAGTASTPRRRRSRSRGQRRVDGSRAHHPANHSRATRVHFTVWPGIDVRNGSVVRCRRVAACPTRFASRRGPRHLCPCRLSLDCPGHCVGLSVRQPVPLKTKGPEVQAIQLATPSPHARPML